MNKIDAIEKEYLLSVNANEFIDSLDAGYIFNDWIENDIYLKYNYDRSSTKSVALYNNISIIGIYNIISNIVSIFFYDLLSVKHKKEFKNIIKPFNLNDGVSINITCNTSFNLANDNRSYFTYCFNGESFFRIEDCIYTKDLSIYEHRIYMPDVTKNDFLRNSLFLYESIVENIFDKLKYF